MTKTIVHAGFHKTGTTTLQQSIFDNRDWMAEHGVDYPDAPRDGMIAHHPLACRLSAPRLTAGPNDLFLPERESFAGSIGARRPSGDRNVGLPPTNLPWRLLSSEIFSTFDDSELAALAAFAEPIDRIVLYRRDGIEFIYSCWAAKVRWGHRGAFDSFLQASLNLEPRTPLVGVVRFVDALIARFGADRVRMRSFDAALKHPVGLIGDFLEEELGLPRSGVFDTALVANRTVSMWVTEVERAVNVLGASPGSAAAGRMRAALRETRSGPEGALLVANFERALRPVTKSIEIADVGPPDFADLLQSGRAGLGALIEGWRFPAHEPVSWIATGDLMDALGGCPAFAGLAAGS